MRGVRCDLSACFFGNHLGGISGLGIINNIQSFLEFFGLLFIVFADTSAGWQRYTIFEMLGFMGFWALPLALYNLPLTIIFFFPSRSTARDLYDRWLCDMAIVQFYPPIARCNLFFLTPWWREMLPLTTPMQCADRPCPASPSISTPQNKTHAMTVTPF